MLKKLGDNRGFSLIETVVAASIMLIVVAVVFRLFMPTNETATVQRGVADVQKNLRVALEHLSNDIRMAGFLTTQDPIVDRSSTAFTINTVTAARRYARIVQQDPSDSSLFHIATESMVERLHVGETVRILRPPNQELPGGYAGLMTVSATNPASRTIRLSGLPAGVTYQDGDMIVRTDSGTAVVNTLRIEHDAGLNLIRRIINEGTTASRSQILAHNISQAEFSYEFNDDGLVKTIVVELTGSTQTDPAGTIPVAQRTLRSSVSLRNL